MRKQRFLAGVALVAVGLTAGESIANIIPASAAAPAYVQSVAAEGSDTSLSAVLPSPVSQGDLLVAIVRTQSTPNVADSLNGGWSEADSDGIESVWYRSNALAGATTVTVTSSDSGAIRASVAEYSGVAAAPPLAAICSSSTDSSTLATSSTASVPAGSLVFAGAMNAESVTATPGTIAGAPATIRAQVSGSRGTIVSEDVLNATGGAQAATFQWTTPVDSRGCVAAFAAATPSTLPPTSVPAPTTTSLPAPTTTSVPTPSPPSTVAPSRTPTPAPTATPTSAPTPISDPASPAGILDLSPWYLTLPIGSGTATMVMQPGLNTYRSQYFDANGTHDGVVLTAPVQGTTTGGSDHTRTELRQTSANGTLPFGWSTGSGTNVMTATEAITHLPGGNGRLGFAQIHGPGSTWYLILEASGNGDGTATLTVKDSTGKADGQVIDPHYVLGTKFGLSLSAVNGAISIGYDGVQKVATTSDMAGAYFKIGAYNQSSGDYGQVEIFNLSLTHR